MRICIKKCIEYGLIAFILYIAVLSRILSMGTIRIMGIPCAADVLIYINYKIYPLFIVPVILFYFKDLYDGEFRVNRVIRMGNLKHIWWHITAKVLAFAVEFATCITVSGLAIAILSTDSVYNWDSYESFSFGITGKINIPPNFLILLLSFWIAVFFMIAVMGMILLYACWYFNQYLVGCIVVLAIAFYELSVRSGYIFYIYTINTEIYTEGINGMKHYIYPVILTAIMNLIGLLCAVKRDFLQSKRE